MVNNEDFEQTESFLVKPVNHHGELKLKRSFRKQKEIRLLLLHADDFDSILTYLDNFHVQPAPANYVLGLFLQYEKIVKKYKNIVAIDEENCIEGDYYGIRSFFDPDTNRGFKICFGINYSKIEGYSHNQWKGKLWIPVIPQTGDLFHGSIEDHVWELVESEDEN